MDMDAIETFIVLAECRNFTRTAERQHIVQSTVSNRIRVLEDYIGKKLIIRDKKGVKLTEGGSLFLKYAYEIYGLKAACIKDISVLHRFEDRLNIYCNQWFFNYWVSSLLTEYALACPDIAVQLNIEHSENIIPLLQDQHIDIAVLSYPLSLENMECDPFRSSEIVLVGAYETFAHLKEGIRRADLPGIPLLYSDIWENYLWDISGKALNDSRLFRIRCNMLDSAKAFCIAGAGCCLLPLVMVEKELEERLLIRIPLTDLEIKTFQSYIIYNKDRMEQPALKNWIRLLHAKDRSL